MCIYICMYKHVPTSFSRVAICSVKRRFSRRECTRSASARSRRWRSDWIWNISVHYKGQAMTTSSMSGSNLDPDSWSLMKSGIGIYLENKCADRHRYMKQWVIWGKRTIDWMKDWWQTEEKDGLCTVKKVSICSSPGFVVSISSGNIYLPTEAFSKWHVQEINY